MFVLDNKVEYLMKTQLMKVFAFITLSICLPCGHVCAQGLGLQHGPSLDMTLMAFKEQGAWYYLCEAPEFQCRTPNHYLSFAPPPPYCPPPVVCAAPPACVLPPMVSR